MAETGIGLRDNFNLNNLNPASYTSIEIATQITELGLFVEKDQLSTSEETQRSISGSLTAINMWFRFSKKWASTVGLAPFSVVNYDILSTRNLDRAYDDFVRYNGQGGLTQVYFGNGFQITKNLSLGFNAFYVFGRVEKNETILTGPAAGLSLQNKTSINRPSIDFGLQYTFFFPEDKSLTLGLTGVNKLRLNTAKSVRVFEISGRDSLYIKQQTIDDYVLPRSIGAGVAFQTTRHSVAMDLKAKQWSRATLDENIDLQNTARFSLAYEYKGNIKSVKYWDFVTLRSGFYLQNNYFTLNGTGFNEWGLTLGAGFPVAENRGMFSVSYNYNRTGTIQNRLIQQTGQVLVLDIVLRDLWGMRRKFE